MTRLLIIGKNNEIPRAAFTLRDAHSSLSLLSALGGTQPPKTAQRGVGPAPCLSPAPRALEDAAHG